VPARAAIPVTQSKKDEHEGNKDEERAELEHELA